MYSLKICSLKMYWKQWFFKKLSPENSCPESNDGMNSVLALLS